MSELTKIHITKDQIQSATYSALRITLSQHEWTWTQAEQEEMATYILWQAVELQTLVDKSTALFDSKKVGWWVKYQTRKRNAKTPCK